MLLNSYSYEILNQQFHRIYLQGNVKLLLVTVNNRLKFEIEIVHELSCHPVHNADLDYMPYVAARGRRLMSTCVRAECVNAWRCTQCERGLRIANDGATSIQMMVL